MPESTTTLYYVHDPMCSWCWGFVPVWQQVQEKLQKQLHSTLETRYVLGGLAADSDIAMPDYMKINIRNHWRKIQQEIPGTEFNYDFWAQCQPRRSTYPACRAIIACGMQHPELQNQMILAIQHAYYLEAKNPSDESVLIKLAEETGLNVESFSRDLNSDACNKAFDEDLLLTRKLGVSSFPSLILLQRNSIGKIPVDYISSENIMRSILFSLSDID